MNLITKKRDGGNTWLQTAESNLKSTKVDRQLQGLRILHDSLIQSQSISILSDDILSAIIENCLSSEGGEVRAQAYRVLQYIYSRRGRSVRWSEVASTLALELSDLENSDNKNVLAAMIGLISSLQDAELVQFFIDSCDSIKKSFYLIDPKMRYVSILGFGKLITKVIQIFDEKDFAIEAHCHGSSKRRGDGDEGGSGGKFESLAESRRAREELFDLFRDTVVLCCRVVVHEPVKVPQDNIDSKVDVVLEESYQSFEACCEVICDMFCLYNSGQNVLTSWTDGLSGRRPGVNTYAQALRNQSVRLETGRLVAVAIRTLLKDNFILLDRRKQYPTSITLSNLISQLIMVLLQEVPVEMSSVFTVFKLITPPVNDSIFAAKKETTDETEPSRSNRALLFHCLPFVREWVTRHLLPSVLELTLPVAPTTTSTSAISKSDLLLYPKLFELLSITLYPSLHDIRTQV